MSCTAQQNDLNQLRAIRREQVQAMQYMRKSAMATVVNDYTVTCCFTV